MATIRQAGWTVCLLTALALAAGCGGGSDTGEVTGTVKVDGGKFVYEEALELVSLLNSRNPLSQVNANVLIWERNGSLRLVVLALFAIIAVVVILLATR